jgi:aquaporin related protein
MEHLLIPRGLGPTLGGLLAAAFYIALKHLKYWEVNPDQDSTDASKSPAFGYSSL